MSPLPATSIPPEFCAEKLVEVLRTRLKRRRFLERYFSLDVAPWAFNLIAFDLSGDGGLQLRYGDYESARQLEHCRFTFSATYCATATQTHWIRATSDDLSLSHTTAAEMLCRIAGTSWPDPTGVHSFCLEKDMQREWMHELLALIHLRAKTDIRAARCSADGEPRHSLTGSVDNPLDGMGWYVVPVMTFEIPFAYLVIDSLLREQPAATLMEVSSAELEDYRIEVLRSRILEKLSAGATQAHAVKESVSELFNYLPVEALTAAAPEPNGKKSWEIEEKTAKLGSTDVTIRVPYCDTLTDAQKEGFNRLEGELMGLDRGLSQVGAAIRQTYRAAAVSSVAAQSLSHNIGSHALSDARLFDENDREQVAALRDFHQYLQGRMDYVTQLTSSTPPHAEPMYLLSDVLAGFLRQRLLLNRLVADRGYEGTKLTVHLALPASDGSKECRLTLSWRHLVELSGGTPWSFVADDGSRVDDVLVAIPGGSVGRHALYTILENVIRNSAKYGQPADHFEISIRLRDPGSDRSYWVVEVSDNLSGFAVGAPEFDALCKRYLSEVVDVDGKPRQSGLGLVEIREAIRFLYPPGVANGADDWKEVSSEGSDQANLANPVSGSGGRGTLTYRIRLVRPRLLGVWVAEAVDLKASSPREGVFFRSLSAEGKSSGADSLSDLSPHLLVIVSPQKSGVEEVAKRLLAQECRLPFRTMIILQDAELERFWQEILASDKRFRVIVAPTLHSDLTKAAAEGTEAGLRLVNTVYDHWLRAYTGLALAPEVKWHLAVCFERGAEVEKLWSAADTFQAESLTVTAYSADGDGDGPSDALWSCIFDTGGGPRRAAGCKLDPAKNPAERLIHFGNHGAKPEEYAEVINEGKVAFSQPFGCEQAPRTFSLLYSPPKEKEAFKFFALTVAEAALTRIGFFDERVVGMFLAENGSKEFSRARVNEAERGRVFPIVASPSGIDKGPCWARNDIDWTAEQGDRPNALLRPKHTGETMAPVEVPPEDLDVLVLHEGIIEELVSRQKLNLDKALTTLARVPRLVRTSGKGVRARSHDANMVGELTLPFLEFSVISNAIAPYVSSPVPERIRVEKIALARALLNTAGEKAP